MYPAVARMERQRNPGRPSRIALRSMRATVVLLLIVARPGSASAAGDATDTLATELQKEGRTIYARQCSRCHGFNMNNNGLLGYDLRKFPKDARDRFVSSVRQGKPPKMPPWGDVLSADEIEALWVYIQAAGAP